MGKNRNLNIFGSKHLRYRALNLRAKCLMYSMFIDAISFQRTEPGVLHVPEKEPPSLPTFYFSF